MWNIVRRTAVSAVSKTGFCLMERRLVDGKAQVLDEAGSQRRSI